MIATAMILAINPLLMLLLGIAVLGALVWIVWPKKGLLSLIMQIRLNSQRVRLEDALKYLFDCEYKNYTCNLNSLAGNLHISGDRTSALVERMLSLGLITMQDNTISLTDTGRSYSLRVIRVHRIWEKYLADETGVAQTDWHDVADRVEHSVTSEQTEKLAAQLGHPVYDPHGDPIPSAAGDIPEPRGRSLNHLEEGDIGRIIHIEDEPQSIYEQLIVQGLYPGMQVYVTDVSDGKVTFAADGDEFTLTPLFASHITVEVVTTEDVQTYGEYDLLSALEIGETAEIAGISPNCRGQQRRRLMDLGIIPGSVISAEMRSASGDPVGYRIMGATIGIRKQQADLIFIHKTPVHAG